MHVLGYIMYLQATPGNDDPVKDDFSNPACKVSFCSKICTKKAALNLND